MKNTDNPISKPVTRKTALLIALASFAAGAGMSWWILRAQATPAPQPVSNYIVQKQAATGENSAPDVSQLPPAQSALVLGNWNYDHQNWAKAMEHYQRAISLGIDNADVRTDLGNVFRFSGEPRKALEQYQIAQREDPRHENSRFNAATLHAQVLDDPANAVLAFQEYLQLFPNGEKAPAARQFLMESEARTRKGGQTNGPAGLQIP